MSSTNTLHAWDTGGDTLKAYSPGEVPSYYRAEVPQAIPPIRDRVEEVLQGAAPQQEPEKH
jgi:hypothetical protein